MVLSFTPTVRWNVCRSGRGMQQSSCLRRQNRTLLFGSSKEDEIAKLQEQIRRLQQAEDQPEDAASNDGQNESVYVDKRSNELERVRGKDSPFTEGDLIGANILEKDDSSGSVNLPLILLGLGAFLFLTVFSQVPVGQEDLSRYSAAPPARVIDLGDLNPDKAK